MNTANRRKHVWSWYVTQNIFRANLTSGYLFEVLAPLTWLGYLFTQKFHPFVHQMSHNQIDNGVHTQIDTYRKSQEQAYVIGVNIECS